MTIPFLALVFWFFSGVAAYAADSPFEVPLKLQKITFTAPVNISAFTIQGVVNAVHGTIKVSPKSGKTAAHIQEVKVQIPVTELATGMSLRDRHMRERIFDPSKEIVFFAKKMTCRLPTEVEQTCQAAGVLEIRGVSVPHTLEFKTKKLGDLMSLAAGETMVKLSDFKIEAPSHLGVKVQDEIQIKIEVLADLSSLGG